MGSETITILGLDGSTDDTGLAIIRFDRQGARKVLATTHFVADATHRNSKTARIKRIEQTHDKLHGFFIINNYPLEDEFGVNVLAYEWHTERNPDVSEALSQAAGAYLTVCIHYCPDRPVCRVNPMTAKATYGAAGLKREQAKPAAIQWARRELSLSLSDTDDAIADACAVCFAAWGVWRQSLLKCENKPLIGRGSRSGASGKLVTR